MTYMEAYEYWLQNDCFDPETKAELAALKGNDKEIEERFYQNLTFGTGGLRGIIGAGRNRMNVYTVRMATQGLANYILKQGEKASALGVVIAHDSRRFSREFAEQAALVLCGNGVRAYLFDSLRPTPVLSFAVRHLSCTAGIVVTASHNPKEYNGYKVYWQDGGQVCAPRDMEIIAEVNGVTDFAQIKLANLDDAKASGLLTILGGGIDDIYIENVKAMSVHPEAGKTHGKDMAVVYTPLHGSGNVPVRRVLKEMGYTNVHVVPEQEQPDPDFATVPYPNPEDENAFTLSKALGEQVGAALLIATDPDSDRLGAMVRDASGEYVTLTGNMIGALMTEYILGQKKALGVLPANGAVISTVVSSKLTRAIAEAYGVTYFEVLTGFKFIGQKMLEFDTQKNHTFLFGFEESNGTLAGPYARDKDAVLGAMLLCEIAAWLKGRGMSLYDGMIELFEKYGYYREKTGTLTLAGLDGLAYMKKAMAYLQQNPPKELCGVSVTAVRDYLQSVVKNTRTGERSPIALPKASVLYYELAEGSWFCVRPSGTEPKIKVYCGVKAATASEADDKLRQFGAAAMAVLNGAVQS